SSSDRRVRQAYSLTAIGIRVCFPDAQPPRLFSIVCRANVVADIPQDNQRYIFGSFTPSFLQSRFTKSPTGIAPIVSRARAMHSDRKESSAPLWCTVLLAAAVLYPASLGPWVYTAGRFDLPTPFVAVAEVVYQPIDVVVNHLPQQFAGWY